MRCGGGGRGVKTEKPLTTLERALHPYNLLPGMAFFGRILLKRGP